ncbi:hypothetical protein CROQUDRAFT_383820 [Cronartium quercuum f. sp. fusiforme G11]|uniref:Uncharacterized protein n=1 Tax=Cronartium quercuum f. sp. fusiforme G11 TaxID=708437 RepID=A0A9P6N623_9BASI|nr:hypothetical protein CROQUDRAFT_383820 [Cronartium quercuum f. sp. fusiforme G11]
MSLLAVIILRSWFLYYFCIPFLFRYRFLFSVSLYKLVQSPERALSLHRILLFHSSVFVSFS